MRCKSPAITMTPIPILGGANIRGGIQIAPMTTARDSEAVETQIANPITELILNPGVRPGNPVIV
jgi:hypothetical protein